MKELVSKMLEAEKDEWSEMQPPEQDVDGAYYTTVGITLFQMIDQNVCNLHNVHVHVATITSTYVIPLINFFRLLL